MTDAAPTPRDLLAAPQLAAVAVLRAALVNAEAALVAAHDALLSGEGPDPAAPEDAAARAALAAIRRMGRLDADLRRYRAQLRASPPPAPPAVGAR